MKLKSKRLSGIIQTQQHKHCVNLFMCKGGKLKSQPEYGTVVLEEGKKGPGFDQYMVCKGSGVSLNLIIVYDCSVKKFYNILLAEAGKSHYKSFI